MRALVLWTCGVLIVAAAYVLLSDGSGAVDVSPLEPRPPSVVTTEGGRLTVGDVEAEPVALAEASAEGSSGAVAVPVRWGCTPAGPARGSVTHSETKYGAFRLEPSDSEALLTGVPPAGAKVAMEVHWWRGAVVEDGESVALALEPRTRTRGLIVDGRTGEGLERVSVVLESRSSPTSRLLPISLTVALGERGSFDIGGWWISPSASDIRLVVSADGFQSRTTDWIAMSGGVDFDLDGFMIALDRPTVWSGRVMARGGTSPLAGALVHAAPTDIAELRQWGQEWSIPYAWRDLPSAITDDEGSFALEMRPPGRLRLVVLSTAHPPWISDAEDVVLGQDRLWDVTLDDPGLVEITVDPAKVGNDDYLLMLRGPPVFTRRTLDVSAGESVAFQGLTAGEYSLDVQRHMGASMVETVYTEEFVVSPGETVRRVWSPQMSGNTRVVYGEVLGALDTTLAVALIDSETLDRVGTSVKVDEAGRFTCRFEHDGPAMAVLFGVADDGHLVTGYVPVDLSTSGLLPTVRFEPMRTSVVVKAGADVPSVGIASTSGQPDLDRVIEHAAKRLALREGEIRVYGLPPGTYEAFTGAPGERAVPFTVPLDGSVDVTLP